MQVVLDFPDAAMEGAVGQLRAVDVQGIGTTVESAIFVHSVFLLDFFGAVLEFPDFEQLALS